MANIQSDKQAYVRNADGWYDQPTAPKGKRKLPLLANTAGDLEQESKSRTYNLVEGLVVMIFVLFVLWGLAYPFDVMLKIPHVKGFSNLLLTGGACYLLFVSPFIHGDTLSSWGLGNPWALWRSLREGSTAKRFTIIAIMLALFVGLNLLNWYHWAEVAKFFNFNKTPLEHANQSFPGILFVFAFGSTLSLVLVLFGIRYDNFISAFLTAMKIALPLLVFIILGAVIQRGAKAFDGFTVKEFAMGVFGYVFWGFVQQLLFSSFFGTRLRKAFGPATSPNNALASGKRWSMSLTFAAGFALIGAPLIYAPLRYNFGAELMPPLVILYFAVFFAPFGALYGYFFAKDRKRLLIATLTGSCFGLIHINSYGLVAVTFLLGIFLTYVFMLDSNRNLVALGFIHGTLGSSFGTFFSHGRAGALNVDYGVGPWNVHHPTWGVMVVPVLCMVAYLVLIVVYLTKIRED